MARHLLRIALLAGFALPMAGCPSKGSDCPSGHEPCGGVCLDPASYQADASNCGACGIRCDSGTCSGGVCQCTGGTTLCASLVPRCRDLQTDATACGACDVSCAAKPGASCQAGTCGCFGANPDDCTTFCTNTQTDRQNCGTGVAGCGQACTKPGSSCGGGICQCLSPRPDDCTTFCTNTQTDPQNCGTGVAGCGQACAKPGSSCGGGTCQCLSPKPDDCGTSCTSTASDPRNCGACGTDCATGATCSAGTCACPAGQRPCAGACVPCATGAACSGAACQCPLPPAAGCGGSCCNGGTGCCTTGGGCPLAHFNGVNGNYFDCGPQDAHTLPQARLAAQSWSPTGTTVEGAGLQCPISCLCRQSATQAAVWCYAGSPDSGLVLVTNTPNCLAAACPFPGNGLAWH